MNHFKGMEKRNKTLSIVMEEDEDESPEEGSLENESVLLTKSTLIPIEPPHTTNCDLLGTMETAVFEEGGLSEIGLLGNDHSENVEEEEPMKLKISRYFDFLDDYIRFDVSRVGISCLSGYSISVQYEDDFLVGKTGIGFCCNILRWNATSRVRLWHNKKYFELEYFPTVSFTKPKNCIYHVKAAGQKKQLGTLHFRDDIVHIYNVYEKYFSIRRKQGANTYLIKTESGNRLASVEIFRGFRGDILYYALNLLGDASSTDKAILIGLTVAMDIRQRESELRFSLLWMPLSCILVICIFSLIPWIFYIDKSS